ncbi:MAG: 30S ribosomal protein S4, partial [Candidatus Yanofskybacteria bacterium]|nr:30S ribosomal protein S4 [Candidatus Yanofskybacteria bacterium]
RIGEKLFLKGERSHSQKSATSKKPYPPGMHGTFKRPGANPTEFRLQLRSKQKVRNIYRMMEKQFKGTVKKALDTKLEPYTAILQKLERRLDNVVFRMGFAQSRDQARQLVNHGHILVNGRKVSIPSYETRIGEVITIREGSKSSTFFSTAMPQWMQNYEVPGWIEMDKGTMTATVKRYPLLDDSGLRVDDLQAIIEYYSR